MRGLFFGVNMRDDHLFHRQVYTKRSLVYGVGINDATYPTKPVLNLGSKKRLTCPFYQKWKSMLERCYSEKYQKKQPTYIGCLACSEWLTFSKFSEWLKLEGYNGDDGFELDKDILKPGNKIYSPEFCVIVPALVNRFLTNSAYKKKSGAMAGSSFVRACGKFKADCHNPFTNKGEHLGFFQTDNEAHLAWKKRKHELACQLADMQTDERVANALRTRYL
jgi:hypothetical protein